jgi:hypothetical protein
MEKSTSIVNLAKALLLFHMKVDKIKKDANNPFFKSKYASLSNILDEIDAPLAEAGIVLSQLPTGEDGLITILIHAESGEYIQSEYKIHPAKNDPQGVGSAISYARRYALTAILALNVDDDDANAATHGYNAPKAVQRNAAPAAIQAKSFTTPPAKPAQQQPLNGDVKILPQLITGSKKYNDTVEKLRARTVTVDVVKQYFILTPEVETVLKTIERTAQTPVEQEPA